MGERDALEGQGQRQPGRPRIWEISKAAARRRAGEAGRNGTDPAIDVAVVGRRRRGVDVTDEPYDARPDRPVLQLAVRAVLWGALGIGAVGGIVALLRPAETSDPAPSAPAESPVVPAPVAGVAELTVERWLTTSADHGDELDGLFVVPPADGGLSAPSADPPTAPEGDATTVPVRRVTTVGGRLLDDGYWAVALLVEMATDGAATPTDLDGAGAADEAAATDQGDVATEDAVAADGSSQWYVQVGIVEDGAGGYVALTTPSVMPPPGPRDPERRLGTSPAAVDEEDPLAVTVERFLAAMLAGVGDPAPYFTPGAEMVPADPPPFQELTLTGLAAEPRDDGRSWVLAQVVAITPDGAQLPLTYDLVVVQRGDGWEVAQLAGFPTLVE